MNQKRRSIGAALLASVMIAGLAACASTPKQIEGDAEAQMLSLLLPSRIEIVEPFTGIRNHAKNTGPGGIELLLQAINTLDDPGLMIVGRVRAELFEYVPASADNRGRRIDHWNIDLSTEEQQRQYWDRITQMYRFQLAVDPAAIPPADRYLMTVTYIAPLGNYLTDECIIERPTDGGRTMTNLGRSLGP